jgi:uncharacterized radical SAM protein YgiQ
MAYLPINQTELKERGIDSPDFVLVSGDAYCDHPSFGVAIIGRLLERHGYTVAIASQPNIEKKEDFIQFGSPRLAWLVTSGNIDSMVNHYTVAKRRRTKDNYTPGGWMGKRPDRAVIRYSKAILKYLPGKPIILGGIEASLRRLAHYDYWDDAVRKSVLMDAGADLLVYGMAEKTIIDVADALASGLKSSDLIYFPGTVWKTKDTTLLPANGIYLPSYEVIKIDKPAYAESYKIQYENTDSITAKPLIEPIDGGYVIQNPPQHPLSKVELDQVYDLPFERGPHPLLEAQGHIPAMDEVRHSIVVNRGCYGGCSFCALTMHQGRRIQSRSEESVLEEAKRIVSDKEFKGYIHDVGGPTANFYVEACDKQAVHGVCKTRQCLHPSPCKNLKVDHSEYLKILRSLRKLEGVKKVFVRSGVRYDYVMYDKDPSFFQELVEHHVSGQLKVAPEHVSPAVLDAMGKPRRELYDKFVAKYEAINRGVGKDQYLVPYLMSSHPGSTIQEAVLLAEYVRDMGVNPEQVQDFYPTPGTLSTAMYHTGIHPITKKPIYTPKSQDEKAMQRALIQYRDPKNRSLVEQALRLAGRTDLIGFGPKCLIKPIGRPRNGYDIRKT